MDGYQMNARLAPGKGREEDAAIWAPSTAVRRKEEGKQSALCGGLVLRRHAVADGHAGVLTTGLLLLLLQVLVVGHLLLLLVGHVARVHAGAGHVGLRSVDIVMGNVLGSLGRDVGGVDAILVGGRVGGIQAGLEEQVVRVMRPRKLSGESIPGSSSCPQPW